MITAVLLIAIMIAPVNAAQFTQPVTAPNPRPLSFANQTHNGAPRNFVRENIKWRATTTASTSGAGGLNFSVALVRGERNGVGAEGFRNVRRNGTAQAAFNGVGAGTYHFRYQRTNPGDGITIRSTGNVLMQSSILPWTESGIVR